MSQTIPIPDQSERERALDPRRSFIVQAPAGSGKTELLTQRFLALLATVEHPEQIMALTFTRKAAGEMRHRIISALQFAASSPEPAAAHQRRTWSLAQTVLQADAEYDWQLMNNPNRLRIQTIDAMCAHLARQMPIVASTGPQIMISDDAEQLYISAAERLLQRVSESDPWCPALTTCLLHMDNDQQRLLGLFVAMLAHRDQWLPHVLAVDDALQLRYQLEASLAHANLDAMQALRNALPSALLVECVELAQFAGQQLASADTADLAETFSELPTVALNDKPQWLALADLLLTQAGSFRKTVTKKQGFPAASSGKSPAEVEQFKQAKQRMVALLEHCADDEELAELFADIRDCPPTAYTDKQWAIVEALLVCLPVLTAQLKVVFSETNEVDFSEVAMSALQALGSFDSPSDLQLRLDYQLKHILVDEFQDTSYAQYSLLNALTEGWERGDARTVFAVGDPMQSIYRFRQAEVGLFVKTAELGLANVDCESLRLQANFRSQSGLIDWINHHFRRTFPQHADIALGAVPYSESVAIHPATLAPVVWHLTEDEDSEAKTLISQIQQLQTKDANASIAILVRARSHLTAILQQCLLNNIAFQAVDLEPLVNRPVIKDLWSLTRAIIHPGDRIAWLSVLRAPWCGLTLADCHALCRDDATAPLLALWEQRQPSLSPDGQQRAAKIMTHLIAAHQHRRRQPLSTTVYQTWLALGGPACYPNENLNDCERFFQLLSRCERGADIADLAWFERRLEQLYAEPDATSPQAIKVMTIHKSKGLEFDYVFLPGLARQPTISRAPLLMYSERPRANGDVELLLAPIKAANESDDAIGEYCRKSETKKERLESARLLYVAATRAKQQLHLSACLRFDNDKPLPPTQYSLLGYLWPHLNHADLVKSHCDSNPTSLETAETHTLQRLAADWQRPFANPQYIPQRLNPADDTAYRWQNATESTVGTLVHRQLQLLAEHGQDYPHLPTAAHWQSQLSQQGFSREQVAAMITTIETAINNTLSCQHGRWCLFPEAIEAHCEYEIFLADKSAGRIIRLDRTFIDKDDKRWIIDYKITHQDDPEPYLAQCEQYGRALRKMERRDIHCGLYFPLTQRWHSWQYRG